MAQRIDEVKYEAMISALCTFASNVYTASSEILTLASDYAQTSSEVEKAVGEIYSKIRDYQSKYADAGTLAYWIADKMQMELDKQRKED